MPCERAAPVEIDPKRVRPMRRAPWEDAPVGVTNPEYLDSACGRAAPVGGTKPEYLGNACGRAAPVGGTKPEYLGSACGRAAPVGGTNQST